MPRANRHFLPGHVWHITHRCHQRKFLLKFARDRRRYLHWVFEAKKRLGLSVLNYTVTSNHVHLLVNDTRSDDWVSAEQRSRAAIKAMGQYGQVVPLSRSRKQPQK
jgi:REP element-mobilizing transposase RayT